MKKIMLLTAAILAVQALPAIAENGKGSGKGHHRGEKMFDESDLNKDGALTQAEVVQAAETRAKKFFDTADADKDGKVTKEEVKARHEEMRKKWAEKKKQRAEGGAVTEKAE